MKTLRTLLLAASTLLLTNLAQAETPAVSADPTTSAPATMMATPPVAPSAANTPYSTDPLVQKRQADGIARAEYRARKKAAKRKMKAEQLEAKSDMKVEKAEATEIRNKAMEAEPAVK